MKLNDKVRIPAKFEYVYNCINDLQVLQKCIPGCEELLKAEDGSLSAIVILKIGSIKAKFKGKILLDLLNGPKKYSLNGEGDGGMAGFANGGTDIELVKDGNEKILKYAARSNVKGKIAQLGTRLVLVLPKSFQNLF